MNEAQYYIANNQFFGETLQSMCRNQVPLYRLNYMKIATEAVNDPASRGKLIQRLYTDIIKKGNFDFGRIGASRGSLTKYEHYDKLEASYECLQGIQEGKPTEAMLLYKELRDILITSRADFEFGYKFNIELVQLTYQTLVLGLHQLIDIAICETTDYLRDVCSIEMHNRPRKGGGYGTIIMTNLRSFVTAYKRGEWSKFIASYKKNREGLLGVITAGFSVVAIVIGILGLIRGIIYFFYNSRTKLSEYAKNEAELLRARMEVERSEGDAAKRQKAMLARLEAISQAIEVKTRASETAALSDMKHTDQDEFNPAALSDSTSDDDFELI